MISVKTSGRIIGALLLIQTAVAPIVHFRLLRPVKTGTTGFLYHAAQNSAQISLAVLLLFMSGAITVGVAVTANRVFRQYSNAMSLWFLALGVAVLSLQAVENVGLLSMLSLSKEYTAGNSSPESFHAPALLIYSFRYWAHYATLIVSGGFGLVLYLGLYRFQLVPRALAAFGVGAVLLQLTAVTLVLAGNRMIFLLIAPLGICHLILIVWLLIKGFREQQPPFEGR